MIDADAVGRTSAWTTMTWQPDDAFLYALAVGATQLHWTTENTAGVEPQALPTLMATRCLVPGALSLAGDIDETRVVHGEQRLVMHRPVPVAGELALQAEVTGLADKGAGSHGIVELTVRGHIGLDGPLAVESVQRAVVVGAGGFGGGALDPLVGAAPAVEGARIRATYATRADQALIFRLCGDRNPLHSDPAFAARAGFAAPILHGLCTYGIVARQLIEATGLAAEEMKSMTARFVAPVFPGECLETVASADGSTVDFVTAVGERVVLVGALEAREAGRIRF